MLHAILGQAPASLNEAWQAVCLPPRATYGIIRTAQSAREDKNSPTALHQRKIAKPFVNCFAMTGESLSSTKPSIVGDEANISPPNKKRKADSQLVSNTLKQKTVGEDSRVGIGGDSAISAPQPDEVTPQQPSSAKVFGAGSSYCGFGPLVASRTFGASTFSSTPKASGFAGLLSANGNGSAESSGFGTTSLPLAAKESRNTTNAAFGGSTTFSQGLFSGSSGAPGAIASGTSTSPLVTLPEHVELTTGEEYETNVMAIRCKSYKWVVEEAKPHVESVRASPGPHNDASPASSIMTTPSHPSVPPSTNFDKGSRNAFSAAITASRENGPSHRWQELGIGPLKLLQESLPALRSDELPKSSDCQPTKLASTRVRLVQRRESAPNGPATKVILNVPVWKESTHAKSSERHVSLTTLNESGMGETYLFKFKTTEEANSFSSKLTDVIAVAKSCVKKST